MYIFTLRTYVLCVLTLCIYIYQIIPLHSRDCLKKTSIKQTWPLTKAMAETKSDTEQTMKLD